MEAGSREQMFLDHFSQWFVKLAESRLGWLAEVDR